MEPSTRIPSGGMRQGSNLGSASGSNRTKSDISAKIELTAKLSLGSLDDTGPHCTIIPSVSQEEEKGKVSEASSLAAPTATHEKANHINLTFPKQRHSLPPSDKSGSDQNHSPVMSLKNVHGTTTHQRKRVVSGRKLSIRDLEDDQDNKLTQDLSGYLHLLNKEYNALLKLSRRTTECSKDIILLLPQWANLLHAGDKMLQEEKNPMLPCNKKRYIQFFLNMIEELAKDKIAYVYLKKAIGEKTSLYKTLMKTVEGRKKVAPLFIYRIKIEETDKMDYLISNIKPEDLLVSISRTLSLDEPIKCGFRWIVVKSSVNKKEYWLSGKLDITTGEWYRRLFKMLKLGLDQKQSDHELENLFKYATSENKIQINELKKIISCYPLLQCLANGVNANSRYAIQEIWPFIKILLQKPKRKKNYDYKLSLISDHDVFGEIKKGKNGNVQVKQYYGNFFKLNIKKVQHNQTVLIGEVNLIRLKWQAKVIDFSEKLKTFKVKINDFQMIDDIPNQFKEHQECIRKFQTLILQKFQTYQAEEIKLGNRALACAYTVPPYRKRQVSKIIGM
jgi:hypothetical protein